MLNQKKVGIFSRKIRKSLAKQFLEVALIQHTGINILVIHMQQITIVISRVLS